jgi:(p)ppGpp synthase/HD superfamily hydrolase
MTVLPATPQIDDARAFLADAYATRLRRRGRSVEHPVAVAELLAGDGQPCWVVAAGLLHDVLEDTDVTPEELAERFGPQIADTVAALTQDDSVKTYSERKRLLRQRTVGAGPHAAAVALADKVAKLRAASERPRRRKLRHYRATLREVEGAYGGGSLATQLRVALARWAEDATETQA